MTLLDQLRTLCALAIKDQTRPLSSRIPSTSTPLTAQPIASFRDADCADLRRAGPTGERRRVTRLEIERDLARQLGCSRQI
ncbi:hypothetical protein [Szabonella alba]|uniref:Uncharacterized protein n=1 Tax=Szabonella alba TaxID=2804194 RepID=A0A8K0VAX4_9RHOB|nr:hypothetical protein [Szabonella alba]MBL4918326.1 hypothetical protein [Szabonella alba]